MTLEQAQTSLAAIEAALANGTSMVVFADRTTMYKSNAELERARDYFAGQVARLTGTRRKQALGYSTKGYY